MIVGSDGGGNWTGGFFRGILRGPIVSMFVGQTLGGFTGKTTREDLQTLSELIEAGKVTPVVDRTFDLVESPTRFGTSPRATRPARSSSRCNGPCATAQSPARTTW